jgi:hypothetical protein
MKYILLMPIGGVWGYASVIWFPLPWSIPIALIGGYLIGLLGGWIIYTLTEK